VRRTDIGRQRGQAMPSVVAVVSVVAIVVALVAFFAGGNDDVARPQAAQSDADAAPTPSGSASPDAADDAARTTARTRSGDGAPARATEAQQKAGPKGEQKKDRRKQKAQRRPRPEPDTGPPDVYVEVYNNTSISGLAAATAAELQDAGWQVVGVDNWRGDIPASTVYYPAGFENEARELAETIGVGRLHGAVAPMRFDRLTVILTPDAA
jgi:hypothetical protein